jgi:hypothetical protein
MKLGARWWYGGMTVAWGIVATAAAAINSRTGLVVQRLFLGITEAGAPTTLHSRQASQRAARAWLVGSERSRLVQLQGGCPAELACLGKDRHTQRLGHPARPQQFKRFLCWRFEQRM